MLYLILILLCDAGIVLGNLALPQNPLRVFWRLVLATGCSTVTIFVLDGVVALAIRRLLPASLFAPESRLFSVGRTERRIYRLLGVRIWRERVPEWGGFTGFHKDRVRQAHDPDYLARFLTECNYGVAIHVAGALCGFLLPLSPLAPAKSILLPVGIANAVLSLMPAIVLRYNTPPLRYLYRRALRNAAVQNAPDPAAEAAQRFAVADAAQRFDGCEADGTQNFADPEADAAELTR